jgi:hypothetical protein
MSLASPRTRPTLPEAISFDAHERSLLADALPVTTLGHRCDRSSTATSSGWATPSNNAGDE